MKTISFHTGGFGVMLKFMLNFVSVDEDTFFPWIYQKLIQKRRLRQT